MSEFDIMAPFTTDEIERNFYIWMMFRDDGVLLINRDELLNQFMTELRDEGYKVLECNGEASSTVHFEKVLRFALQFPPGAEGQTNRDAFRDHLGDLEFPDCTGIVVAIRNGDSLYHKDRKYLDDIMDIFAGESHYHLCFGNRLGLIVQFRNKDISLPIIGGHRPVWDMRAFPLKIVHKSDPPQSE